MLGGELEEPKMFFVALRLLTALADAHQSGRLVLTAESPGISPCLG